MGKDPDRESPFFVMKPANAVVDASLPTRSPPATKGQSLHHEIELVVAIGHGDKDIAVGLDMTRRDLQPDARDMGRPWAFGKSFRAGAGRDRGHSQGPSPQSAQRLNDTGDTP